MHFGWASATECTELFFLVYHDTKPGGNGKGYDVKLRFGSAELLKNSSTITKSLVNEPLLIPSSTPIRPSHSENKRNPSRRGCHLNNQKEMKLNPHFSASTSSSSAQGYSPSPQSAAQRLSSSSSATCSLRRRLAMEWGASAAS